MAVVERGKVGNASGSVGGGEGQWAIKWGDWTDGDRTE